MAKVRFDLWESMRTSEANEKYCDLIICRDYSNLDKPVVSIWKGKQSRPYSHYYYVNIEQAEGRINREKESAKKRTDSKLKQKEILTEARKNFKSSFNKNDILVCSWGYDQTNVNYYKVLEVKGKKITLQEIGYNYVEEGFMSGHVTPDTDKTFGTPIVKTISILAYGDNIHESIKINSSIRLYKWDGRPNYMSYYA